MSGENQKKGKILASKFANWYYSDSTDTKVAGEDLIFNIKTNGYFNLTIREIYDSCGPAIPGYICHDLIDPEDEDETDLAPEELEFVDDLTEQKTCYDCRHKYTGDLDYCPNCLTCVS